MAPQNTAFSSEAAPGFREYVEKEIEFYKKYYQGPVYRTLYKWRSESSEDINIVRLLNYIYKEEKDPKLLKEISLLKEKIELNQEFNDTKQAVEKGKINSKDVENITTTIMQNDDLKAKLPFQKIIELLESFKIDFDRAYHDWSNQIRKENKIYKPREKETLHLGLWNSSFINDDNNQLTPFGRTLTDGLGEPMGHQRIGVFDALEQHLGDEHMQDYPHNWTKDLNRAQVMLICAYKQFEDFLKELGGDSDDLIEDLVETLDRYDGDNFEENLKKLVETIITCLVPSNAIPLKSDSGNGSSLDHFNNEVSQLFYSYSNKFKIKLNGTMKWPFSHSHLKKCFQEFKNELKGLIEIKGREQFGDECGKIEFIKKEKNFESFAIDALSVLESTFVDISDDDDKEKVKSNLKNRIKKLTRDHKGLVFRILKKAYLKADYKNPPLVQLVPSYTSLWVSDKEVPSIMTINDKKAKSIDQEDNLMAYSALPHELGHDIMDTFRDDLLYKELKKSIQDHPKISPQHKEKWANWVMELFADVSAVMILGKPAIKGLQDVVRYMDQTWDIIRKNQSEEDIKYTHHPNSYIRVLFTIKLAENYKKGDAGELTKLEKKWKNEMWLRMRYTDIDARHLDWINIRRNMWDDYKTSFDQLVERWKELGKDLMKKHEIVNKNGKTKNNRQSVTKASLMSFQSLRDILRSDRERLRQKLRERNIVALDRMRRRMEKLAEQHDNQEILNVWEEINNLIANENKEYLDEIYQYNKNLAAEIDNKWSPGEDLGRVLMNTVVDEENGRHKEFIKLKKFNSEKEEEIEALWEKLMALLEQKEVFGELEYLYDTAKEVRVPVKELADDIPHVINAILTMKAPCMTGKSIETLFKKISDDECFKILAEKFIKAIEPSKAQKSQNGSGIEEAVGEITEKTAIEPS